MYKLNSKRRGEKEKNKSNNKQSEKHIVYKRPVMRTGTKN